MATAKDVCVALTFDYDGMSNWIGSLRATSVRFTTLCDYARAWRSGRTPELPADAGTARA